MLVLRRRPPPPFAAVFSPCRPCPEARPGPCALLRPRPWPWTRPPGAAGTQASSPIGGPPHPPTSTSRRSTSFSRSCSWRARSCSSSLRPVVEHAAHVRGASAPSLSAVSAARIVRAAAEAPARWGGGVRGVALGLALRRSPVQEVAVTWSTAETLLEASVVGVRLLHFDGSDAVAVSSARQRISPSCQLRIRFRRSHFPSKKVRKKKNQKKIPKLISIS